ncbi:MAG: hypothetical protein HRT89_12315 [Lentisphaeria bacterium]|nr:hypothetical protein [Lentisphaeria bacterium]NQZ68841.1 hypothetical protein [Lentisphaeria bacterium]
MIQKTKICLILSFIFQGLPAYARTVKATPANYLSQLKKLKPGDTLQLKKGNYTKGFRIRGIHGKKGKPISILGDSGKTILLGRRGSNTMDLTDCSWIIIKNLTFDGQNFPVDAIKAGKDSSKGVHHITIDSNLIIRHGANQQIVGISSKVPAWDWLICNNIILGAGTGIYLGNSDGNQPFIRGIIENNIIKDPLGYCMQVKHQNSRPKVPGIPIETASTIIRYNFFIKSDKHGKDGLRPNLLVSGYPDSGPGAKDRYEIYGNIFSHNTRESLFQGTGTISLHDNIFLDAQETAIRIMTHNRKKPLDIRIYHNTFFKVGTAVKISGLNDGPNKMVKGNLLIVNKKITWPGNMVFSGDKGIKKMSQPSLSFGEMDFQLKKVTRKKDYKIDKKILDEDADSKLDFWQQSKNSFDHCGAISKAFKKAKPVDLVIRKTTK